MLRNQVLEVHTKDGRRTDGRIPPSPTLRTPHFSPPFDDVAILLLLLLLSFRAAFERLKTFPLLRQTSEPKRHCRYFL